MRCGGFAHTLPAHTFRAARVQEVPAIDSSRPRGSHGPKVDHMLSLLMLGKRALFNPLLSRFASSSV